MPPQPFLLGLLSAFDNRYQAAADAFFKEITWKQFFAIICIELCREAPTINELSEVMGSKAAISSAVSLTGSAKRI